MSAVPDHTIRVQEFAGERRDQKYEVCALSPDKTLLGCVTAARARWLEKDERSGPRFEVHYAWIDDRWLRRGLATRLYERAAREACKRGGPLQSDIERSHEADSFWEKQASKGRATYHRTTLLGDEVDFYRLRCPAPRSLSASGSTF